MSPKEVFMEKKANPFSQKCIDCTPNILQKFQEEKNFSPAQNSETTLIWIEKIKDD